MTFTSAASSGIFRVFPGHDPSIVRFTPKIHRLLTPFPSFLALS
jgi:hypothetical protein